MAWMVPLWHFLLAWVHSPPDGKNGGTEAAPGGRSALLVAVNTTWPKGNQRCRSQERARSTQGRCSGRTLREDARSLGTLAHSVSKHYHSQCQRAGARLQQSRSRSPAPRQRGSPQWSAEAGSNEGCKAQGLGPAMFTDRQLPVPLELRAGAL